MDGHIALDFLTGGCSAMCVIISTFCSGTNKIMRAEQDVSAIMKNLSGFQVDSHGFQDLVSWSGLGKWGC